MGSSEEQELILYALVDGDYIPVSLHGINEEDTCKGCNNHPSNGGNGVCHCILGNKTWN